MNVLFLTILSCHPAVAEPCPTELGNFKTVEN